MHFVIPFKVFISHNKPHKNHCYNYLTIIWGFSCSNIWLQLIHCELDLLHYEISLISSLYVVTLFPFLKWGLIYLLHKWFDVLKMYCHSRVLIIMHNNNKYYYNYDPRPFRFLPFIMHRFEEVSDVKICLLIFNNLIVNTLLILGCEF